MMLRDVLGRTIGLVVLVLALLPAGTAAAAAAQDKSSTVTACLLAKRTWLHVQTETGEVLRSECVGTPANGLAALANAKVATTKAKGGYLCTLAGHPKKCPTRFAGQYWQYWTAATVGAPWVHSPVGPAKQELSGGTIEGWCYNEAKQKYCSLPDLQAGERPAERVDLASAQTGARGYWPIAVAVLALAATGLWVRRRRD